MPVDVITISLSLGGSVQTKANWLGLLSLKRRWKRDQMEARVNDLVYSLSLDSSKPILRGPERERMNVCQEFALCHALRGMLCVYEFVSSQEVSMLIAFQR